MSWSPSIPTNRSSLRKKHSKHLAPQQSEVWTVFSCTFIILWTIGMSWHCKRRKKQCQWVQWPTGYQDFKGSLRHFQNMTATLKKRSACGTLQLCNSPAALCPQSGKQRYHPVWTWINPRGSECRRGCKERVSHKPKTQTGPSRERCENAEDTLQNLAGENQL